MGDPEHFKRHYTGLWKKHKDDTLELKNELATTHPQLMNVMKLGYSVSDEYKEFSPDEKAEPSITIHKDFHEKCCIWVTGSDKDIPATSDLWIRPDKIAKAKIKNEVNIKCYFYLKYPKVRYVLELDDVIVHINNIQDVNLKGVREQYVAIPVSKAKPVDNLHDWIKNNY